MDKSKGNKKYWIMFLILGLLFIFSVISSFFMNIGDDTGTSSYNVALIPIKGEITTEQSSGLFSSDVAASTDIVKLIEKARKDSNVKAIIFEINSPGGSPVATDEISQEIKSLKAENITTVAWIREEGASGAYWIATSTDHIVANRMSIVGSIGVYGSYIEWYGLMNRYNVTYNRLVSGEYKDMGVPYRPMTAEEEQILQLKLDKLHDFFIKTVAENRKMSVENVTALATGEFFLGVEAKDNGLIDELGGQPEAISYIQNKMNLTVSIKEFSKQRSFIESLMQSINQNSYYMGQGIGSSMFKNDNLKITT